MEIRLRIFSANGSSTGAKGAFRSWGFGKTSYKNMEVVDDESYTHACVINDGKKPMLKVKRDKVVGFHQEVHELVDIRRSRDWIDKNVGCYFVYDLRYMSGPNIREWYTFLPNMPLSHDLSGYINPKKPFPMSIIASDKKFMPGHALRHELIKRILKSDLDIHIYGRGSHLYRGDPRVKGEIGDKRIAFKDYKLTIAIENRRFPFWITEKFVDPLLCGCVPLYHGAQRVSKVFGEDSHYVLPSDPDKAFGFIREAYRDSKGMYGRKSPKGAQDRLMGKANFADFLVRHFCG